MTTGAVFVFDGHCSMCQAFASWAAKRSSVRFSTDEDLTSFGVAPDEYRRHAVFVSGEVYRGSAAIAALLRQMSGPWPLLGWLLQLPGPAHVARPVYRLIARNRPHACVVGTADSTVATVRTPAARYDFIKPGDPEASFVP